MAYSTFSMEYIVQRQISFQKMFKTEENLNSNLLIMYCALKLMFLRVYIPGPLLFICKPLGELFN